jgi:chemotaxis protein methyltransferase CheR
MYQLYQQVEHTLGIRASAEALVHLKDYINQLRTQAKLAPQTSRTVSAPFALPDTREPDGFDEGYGHIFSSPQTLFDLARLLTVNETYFFREQAHFSLLLRELLPEFAALGRPLRICSAATSIGCEAYSIAMVLDYYKQSFRCGLLSWEIDAFDIDYEVIETAREGSYRSHAFRDDGVQWKFLLNRYVSNQEGKYQVDSRLKEHIHFYLHNVMDGLPSQTYDLIFFRNVSIYFSDESRMKALEILSNALIPGGCLIVGISETAGIEHPQLTNCFKEDAFYFQKRAAAPPPVILTPASPRIVPKLRELHSLKKRLIIEPLHIAELMADDTAARLITEKTLSLLGGLPDSTLDESGHIRDNAVGTRKRSTPDEHVAGLVCMGNELITSLIVVINQGDSFKADCLLAFIEQYDHSAYTHFLRGEYFYLKANIIDAESSYKRAVQQDKTFWPAFYRLASLAALGNPLRYVHKVNQALESIIQGKERGYEVFIGGFSPDYYQHALEKQRHKGLCAPYEPWQEHG